MVSIDGSDEIYRWIWGGEPILKILSDLLPYEND
jgi:hypothetical protein